MGFTALRRIRKPTATTPGVPLLANASTCRVSHPLGALLRRNPSQPYFMPVTSMGFRLQRISPRGSQQASSASLPFLSFAPTSQVTPSRDSKDLSTRAIRASKVGFTRTLNGRSSPSVDPSEVFTSVDSARKVRRPTVPPLMGFNSSLNGCPPNESSALQSVRELQKRTLLLRGRPTSRGFASSSRE